MAFIIQQLEGGGLSDPVVGRIQFGLVELLDSVNGCNYGIQSQVDERNINVNHIMGLYAGCVAARNHVEELSATLEEHVVAVKSRSTQDRDPRVLRVPPSIDVHVNQEFVSAVMGISKTIKTGLQDFLRHIGIEIGLLFEKKDAAFDDRVAELQQRDGALADYLRVIRTWTGPLVKLRNSIEHDGWELARIQYEPTSNGIDIKLPTVNGTDFIDYLRRIVAKSLLFVEEASAHALRPSDPLRVLVEVPESKRSARAPARFRVGLDFEGIHEQAWELRGSANQSFSQWASPVD